MNRVKRDVSIDRGMLISRAPTSTTATPNTSRLIALSVNISTLPVNNSAPLKPRLPSHYSPLVPDNTRPPQDEMVRLTLGPKIVPSRISSHTTSNLLHAMSQ
ncbi:hypothetical protein RRG08_063196 [Elysia crispata]|uniref:Uncharacterized protein n=1 Tax=Elysia crispata TaxID=231223 RepID=A0AAE1D4G0_9GAST|nr:hypothetical protein RRG08_063196 [Elysia crispata]